MAHERAEAGLAAAAVHLLGEHGAVERERDLRRQGARRGLLGLGGDGVARDDQRRPAGRVEGRAARRAARCVAGGASGGGLRGAEPLGRRPRRPRRRAVRLSMLVARRDVPAAATTAATRSSPVPHRDAEGGGGAGSGERARGGDGDAVDLLAAGGRDELGARSAEDALAFERAFLLADEPGHPQDHEPEEHDRCERGRRRSRGRRRAGRG